MEQIYIEGAIVYSSWGYEQTNIDFYKITKRTASTVTLQPIGQKREATGDMTWKVMPDPDNVLDKPALRRKVCISKRWVQGQQIEEEIGMRFEPSYGWIGLWDGKPKHASGYA